MKKIIIFIFCLLLISVNVQAFKIDSENIEGTDLGTLTDGRVCSYDLTNTEIDCNLLQDGSGDCAASSVCTGGHSHSDKQNLLTNSAGLAGALSDETGTTNAVFSDSPALTGSPTITGTPAANTIVNGTFDTDVSWTKGAGWTIDVADSNNAIATATTGNLNETASTVVANRLNKLCWTAVVTGGTYQVTAGGWTSATYSASATAWCEYYYALSTAAVTFDGVTAFTGTIDTVTNQEVESAVTVNDAYFTSTNTRQPMIFKRTMDSPTGNQEGYKFTCQTNKATSGTDTCFEIITSDIASPGVSRSLRVRGTDNIPFEIVTTTQKEGLRLTTNDSSVGFGSDESGGQLGAALFLSTVQVFGVQSNKGVLIGDIQTTDPPTNGARIQGPIVNVVQTATCTAGAGVSALTVTPTSSYIEITNSDADGCNVTMDETGILIGAVVTICVVSNAGTTVNFADTAGVSELAGAFAADIDDCITLRYGNTTTWREISRSVN